MDEKGFSTHDHPLSMLGKGSPLMRCKKTHFEFGFPLSIHWGSFSEKRIEQMMQLSSDEGHPGKRLANLSRFFLDLPYNPSTNVGHPAEYDLNGVLIKPGVEEQFTVNLQEMDCMTYIEVCLALSNSLSWNEFLYHLRRIRYAEGMVKYDRRNHYVTQWIENNMKQGYVQDITKDLPNAIPIQRELNLLKSIEPVWKTFWIINKWELDAIFPLLEEGDIIAFVPKQEHLDVSHIAILVKPADTLLLRHSSRIQKGVVDNGTLQEYLIQSAYIYLGIIVVRPMDGISPLMFRLGLE